MRLCSLQLKYLNLLASPIRYRGELSDCRNLIFRRNFPIHKLFERSCDLGLLRLSADRIAQVFGWRLHKRLSGKLSSVLEKTHHAASRIMCCAPMLRTQSCACTRSSPPSCAWRR